MLLARAGPFAQKVCKDIISNIRRVPSPELVTVSAYGTVDAELVSIEALKHTNSTREFTIIRVRTIEAL